MIGVAVLAKKVRIGNRDYNKEFISSGDPNRRLGFAVSFRYSLIKGFRITFGPWVNQLSNRQLIDTILPFFIVIPTLVLFCVNIVTAVLKAIMNGFLFLVMSKTRGDNSSIQPEFITSTVATDNTSINVSSSSTHNQISYEMSTANDDQLHLSASKQSSNQTTTKKNKNSDKNKINKIASKKKFSRKKYDPRALHSRILQYVSSKGPGMGCSAGTYITRDDGIYLGGNTFIDIQGLYPFKSELLYLCDQIVELKNGISTAVGSWYKSIFNFRPKGDTAASDIDINDQRNHMSETNNNGYIDNNNTIPFTELRGGHIASKNTTKRSRRSRNKSSK